MGFMIPFDYLWFVQRALRGRRHGRSRGSGHGGGGVCTDLGVAPIGEVSGTRSGHPTRQFSGGGELGSGPSPSRQHPCEDLKHSHGNEWKKGHKIKRKGSKGAETNHTPSHMMMKGGDAVHAAIGRSTRI